MVDLDAIVLATEATSLVRVAGLTAVERGKRVAARVGATRVLVVEKSAQLADVATWRASRSCPVLVINANQFVHTGLVAPLIEALPRDGVAIAVVPESPAVGDLTVGAYAGAFVVAGAAVDRVVAQFVAGDVADDVTLVGKLTDVTRVPHGEIARAPLRTRDEIKQAHRILYRILVKPQDNAITRYLYRPVSFPLTRLLVWTPITPNQVTYLTAALVALGCWITASASFAMALLGTVIVLVASYVDCCDGEVARVKLMSSRYGAWIDTIIDELSSIGYMIAIGWHCHLQFGPSWFGPLPFDPWKAAIVVGTIGIAWSVYCIYYNIIVAVGSANSQDYVGRFDVVPGRQPNSVRLAPAAAKAIVPKQPLPWPLDVIATFAPYIVRRDFICWLAVVLAATQLTHVAFGLLVVGGVITSVITTIDHLKLRQLRRSIERRGMLLEAP